MDKIKFTLDDLRARINVMRKKFRQYTIKTKRSAQLTRRNSDFTSDDGDDGEFDEDEERNERIKLCVFIKETGMISSVYVNRTHKIRTLKNILLEREKLGPGDVHIDDLILSFNGMELVNDSYTIEDYNIEDTNTITLEFDQR